MNKSEYVCPICGDTLRIDKRGSDIHDHYVEHLERKFNDEDFKTIREGKLPRSIRESTLSRWGTPDIFVLQNLTLVKVVEVVVSEWYESSARLASPILEKCKKIVDYLNPSEIIVFEPLDYKEKTLPLSPDKKRDIQRSLGLAKLPNSYKEIENAYSEKWKKEGLDVTFWNEANLSRLGTTSESNEGGEKAE